MFKGITLRGTLAAAALALTSTAAVNAAGAETFEDAAVNARRIQDPARLVWSFGDACKVKGDQAKRACQGIRAARQAALTGKTFVSTTTGGVEVGKFDKGAIGVSAKGCVLCAPAKVDGDAWFIVTKGGTGDEGGMSGPALGTSTQKVADESEAKRWAAEDATRLTTEVVYKLTGDKVAGKTGANALIAEVVAWRLLDRCSGEVLASAPASAAGGAPSQAGDCAGVAATPQKGKGGDQPADDGTPVELSRWDIQRTMNALKPAANACYKKYQIPGNSTASVEIAPDGTVKSVSMKGDFQGTPTGGCLIKVVQGATFPKFKKGPIKIDYPFILR